MQKTFPKQWHGTIRFRKTHCGFVCLAHSCLKTIYLQWQIKQKTPLLRCKKIRFLAGKERARAKAKTGRKDQVSCKCQKWCEIVQNWQRMQSVLLTEWFWLFGPCVMIPVKLEQWVFDDGRSMIKSFWLEVSLERTMPENDQLPILVSAHSCHSMWTCLWPNVDLSLTDVRFRSVTFPKAGSKTSNPRLDNEQPEPSSFDEFDGLDSSLMLCPQMLGCRLRTKVKNVKSVKSVDWQTARIVSFDGFRMFW